MDRDEVSGKLREIIYFHDMSYKNKYEELQKYCITIQQKRIEQDIRVTDLLKTICVNQPKLSVALNRPVHFSRPVDNVPHLIINKHSSTTIQQSNATKPSNGINNLIDRETFEKVVNEVRKAKTVSLSGLISNGNQWHDAQKYERMIQKLQSDLLEQRNNCQELYKILLGIEKNQNLCFTDLWKKNCQLHNEKADVQQCNNDMKLEIAKLKSEIHLLEAAETGSDVNDDNSACRREHVKLLKLRQELEQERQNTNHNSILFKMVYEELGRINDKLKDYEVGREDYEKRLKQADNKICSLNQEIETLEAAFEAEEIQKDNAQRSLHRLQTQYKRLVEINESASPADSS